MACIIEIDVVSEFTGCILQAAKESIPKGEGKYYNTVVVRLPIHLEGKG